MATSIEEMSFEHKKILRMYGDYLVNHIKPTEKMLLVGCSKGLLNQYDAEDIRKIPDSHSKVAKIVRIVKTSGSAAFRIFCEMLEDSNQDIAAQLLRSAELASKLRGRLVEDLSQSIEDKLQQSTVRMAHVEKDLASVKTKHRTDTKKLKESLKLKEKKRDEEMAAIRARLSGIQEHAAMLEKENREQKQQILTLEWALRSVSESVLGSAIDLHTQGRRDSELDTLGSLGSAQGSRDSIQGSRGSVRGSQDSTRGLPGPGSKGDFNEDVTVETASSSHGIPSRTLPSATEYDIEKYSK